MDPITSYIYGLCMMFYSMMAWLFRRKGNDNLSRLIMWLMLLLDIECAKDIITYSLDAHMSDSTWHIMTASDMIIIPFYIFVLMELVKPGWLTWSKGILHEMPFIFLPLLYKLTGNILWFDALSIWGAIYGCATFILTFFFISQYHKQLKERFSYQENINLNWLRGILSSFFVILLIWTMSCFMTDTNYDNIYMLSSLGIWMVVSYFVYKHESVMDELNDYEPAADFPAKGTNEWDNMTATIQRLFVDEKLYLTPKLKLSDVAKLVGTNRTYLSQYFNQENGQTFYDYVNNYRIKYAEELLRTSSAPLVCIAEEAGFNSLSTFRRVFANHYGCSPAEYRKKVLYNI